MKNLTPGKLPNRLTHYGALSLAIAGMVDANGQIIYTDIADTGPLNQTYSLDLDGAGTFDFYIRHAGSTNYNQILDILPEAGGNAIIGGASGYKYFPFALSAGYLISSGNSNWNSNYQYHKLNSLQCYNFISSWCYGVFDKYLGLRFEIGSDTHYGWARLDVDPASINWLIKDYAYEQTRDTPIMAGAGSLGLDDDLISKVKIVALNKSIALSNLPESVSYKLFSMTGQTILNGQIAAHVHVIEAETLANGVYIIELRDNQSKAMIRHKIVL